MVVFPLLSSLCKNGTNPNASSCLPALLCQLVCQPQDKETFDSFGAPNTVRVEIFGNVIFSVNRERRCSVERNFRYRAHCLFEGVANVR